MRAQQFMRHSADVQRDVAQCERMRIVLLDPINFHLLRAVYEAIAIHSSGKAVFAGDLLEPFRSGKSSYGCY